jgi:hypothetical protein
MAYCPQFYRNEDSSQMEEAEDSRIHFMASQLQRVNEKLHEFSSSTEVDADQQPESTELSNDLSDQQRAV